MLHVYTLQLCFKCFYSTCFFKITSIFELSLKVLIVLKKFLLLLVLFSFKFILCFVFSVYLSCWRILSEVCYLWLFAHLRMANQKPKKKKKSWQVVWMVGAYWLNSLKGNLAFSYYIIIFKIWPGQIRQRNSLVFLRIVLPSIYIYSFNPYLVVPYLNYQCNPEIFYFILSR